jgi:serine/threonine protein phosphatase PrpC
MLAEVQAPTRVDIAGLSHAGKVRSANEDHFAIMTMRKSVELRGTNLQEAGLLDRVRRPEAHILVVADGVGGATGGKLASEIAVRAVTTG